MNNEHETGRERSRLTEDIEAYGKEQDQRKKFLGCGTILTLLSTKLSSKNARIRSSSRIPSPG